MRILFFGDVVGKSGRQAIQKYLKKLRDELSADVVVCQWGELSWRIGYKP